MANCVEPIRDIATLGSIELFTPKPDRSLWYFKDVLGMEAVHTEGDSVYYDEQKYVARDDLRSMRMNLPQTFTGRGAAVRHTDHLAVLCKDAVANRRFAEELIRRRSRSDRCRARVPIAVHFRSHHLGLVSRTDSRGAR